jgi:hypothetical protein
MKRKTVAAWLAFVGGPLGLHRFYLHGGGDWIGRLLLLPTVAGLYGVERMRKYGVDDSLSWWLIPLLGFTVAATSLTAIYYGLMSREKWNARFNPGADEAADAGATSWFTIAAVVLALMIGTGCLMATLAFSFQHFFEWQIEEGRKISQ